jgi:hypothetical protein
MLNDITITSRIQTDRIYESKFRLLMAASVTVVGLRKVRSGRCGLYVGNAMAHVNQLKRIGG